MRDKTYFISDLHLGSGTVADRKAREAVVVGFLRSIREDARALYLLGDILDYWYEYRTVVPRGFVRFFGVLAELADCGVEIFWMVGNHDVWLFDYLSSEIGLTVLDPAGGGMQIKLNGTRIFIAHGDGIGDVPPAMGLMRRIFRNRLCQALYSAVHPRWTVGLALGLSAGSRRHGMKEAVRRLVVERSMASVRKFAENYSSAHPDVRYIVLGHYHLAIDEPVGKSCRLIILGDWISHFTYGVFDGKIMHLKQYATDAQCIN